MVELRDMTQERWDSLSRGERERLRDLSPPVEATSDIILSWLSPQLLGLEGWRVEVKTTYGETRRFIVGRSTGWRPCHIEVKRRTSFGGVGAEREYESVKRLYKVR